MTRKHLISGCAALAVAASCSTPAIAGEVSGFVYDGTETIALQATS